MNWKEIALKILFLTFLNKIKNGGKNKWTIMEIQTM